METPAVTGQIARRLKAEIERHLWLGDEQESNRALGLNYVARRAKVPYKSLRLFMKGEIDLRLSTVQRLCDYLDVRLTTRQDRLQHTYPAKRPRQ